MTDLRVIEGSGAESLDDASWDAFVAGSPRGHLLQTSRWGQLKARFGWATERVALMQGDSLVAGAQMLYKALPFGQTLAYVARGPVVDWDDRAVVEALMFALRAAARRRHAFCLKIEPDVVDKPGPLAGLVALGLRPSSLTLQPKSSILVDLCRTEDKILAEMKPKCRYNIRLAGRKGVLVQDATEADLQTFARLMEKTGRREKFAVHSEDYYRSAYRLFAPSGHARLLLATYRGVALAGIMVFMLARQAWYMYGASDDVHRNVMPNYLLQWQAIQWARSRGCTSYDMWGIPDEVGRNPQKYVGTAIDRTDDLWGVYRFKQGFGGRVTRYVGAYDDVYLEAPYKFFHGAGAFLERRWGGAWHRRLRAG